MNIEQKYLSYFFSFKRQQHYWYQLPCFLSQLKKKKERKTVSELQSALPAVTQRRGALHPT